MKKEIYKNFGVSNKEYAELDKAFGNLCNFAAWDLIRKNSNNYHTNDHEDIAQELKCGLAEAAAYYKRQVYIEGCLKILEGKIKNKFIALIHEQLCGLWRDRKHHGAGRQKFGKYQEDIMQKLILTYIPAKERPDKTNIITIDSKFKTYCKSIIWNRQKHLGKKISRDRSFRQGLVSLSEYEHLEFSSNEF